MSKIDFPSEYTEQEELNYRPITPWAIMALLLCPLSALAFIGPPYWFFSVLASAIGGFALFTISRSDNRASGKALAVAAIVISCFFLGAGSSRYYAYRGFMFARAEIFVQHWAKLIAEDRLQEAHQLRSEPSDRVPLDVPLADHYEPTQEEVETPPDPEQFNIEPSAYFQLVRFVKSPPLNDVIAMGDKAQWRLVENVKVEVDPYKRAHRIEQVYEITAPDHKPVTLHVTSDRLIASENGGETAWIVQNYHVPAVTMKF